MMLEHRMRIGWQETDHKVYRGIFWRIWLEKKHVILSLLGGWYLGLILLLAFGNPLVLGVYGLLAAVALSSNLGGGDIMEDCEEFTFSLPPTRMEWFWARFWTGLLPLLFMMILGVFAIYFDLPQRLWSWIVDSGFTVPVSEKVRRFSREYGTYLAAIVVPASCYIYSFVLAAFSPVRSLARVTFAHGFLLTFTMYALGMFVEKNFLFQDVNGWISNLLLLLADTAFLFAAAQWYPRKEGVFFSEILPGNWKAFSVMLVWCFAGILWVLILTL